MTNTSNLPVVQNITSHGMQLAANNGSIINYGSVTVYIATNENQIGDYDSTFPLPPGGALPWPDSVCWAFTEPGELGSVYVIPVQAALYPLSPALAPPTGTAILFCNSGSTILTAGYNIYSVQFDTYGSTSTECGVQLIDEGTSEPIAGGYLNSQNVPGIRSFERNLAGYLTQGPLYAVTEYGSNAGNPNPRVLVEYGS